jgi:cytidyltransferase-like protein
MPRIVYVVVGNNSEENYELMKSSLGHIEVKYMKDLFRKVFNSFGLFLSLVLLVSPGHANPLEALPQSNNLVRIGIFTGTFDPPTNGHLGLIDAGLDSGLDYVIVIPNNQTSHKPNATSYAIRRKLTEVAFQGNRRVFVPSARFDAEQMTIATIQFVTSRIPNAVVVSIIGSDVSDLMLGRIPGYKPEQNSEWIKLVNEWLVVLRGGEATPPPLTLFDRKVVAINDVPGATSSTAVRNSIFRSESRWDRGVPPAVAEKIRQLRLYINRCESLFLAK